MFFHTALGLALSFCLVACPSDDGNESADTNTEVGDGDGDTGDGDGDATTTGGECIPAPEECLRFVNCIGAIVPAQAEATAAEYGEGGTCWCNGVDEANSCYTTCLEQLDSAIMNYPLETACHQKSCTLDELDPSEPYGPVENGACPEWSGLQQIPLQGAQLGIAGSVCSPPCSGIAQSCPDHSQTVAQGTCFLTVGDSNYCVSRCYVNSAEIFPSGTQCQCGATCQPYGGSDGEGNPRGICTFE